MPTSLAQNLNSSTLTNANLTNANLANANVTGAIFSGGTLNGADIRGATGFSAGGASATNAILPDGIIAGLQLDAGNQLLVVRNYSGGSPIPIHVTGGVSMQDGTTIQMLLDNNPWGSTIPFASSTSVSLGGNLELNVTPDAYIGLDLLGDSFQLFDWSGVTPTGHFNIVNDLAGVEGPGGPLYWDTSALYTTGVVTLVPEPSSLALLGVGAIGLLGYAWRRRTAGHTGG